MLPIKIKEILLKLEKSGYEAYVVGGAVRDIIMGKSPDDYDITTSARPTEVKSVFQNEKIIDTGIKHGTVTLLYKGLSVEITTYRTEKGYTDSRHPDRVEFTASLKEDLSRRDFTVNAICLSSFEKIIDPFGGINDIKNKSIKTVGVPSERFSEDALRIFRAVRFASVLGFEIEKQTERAAIKLKECQEAVSKERIFTEFKKTLFGSFVGEVLGKYYPVVFAPIEPLKRLQSEYENINFGGISHCRKDIAERIVCMVLLPFLNKDLKEAESAAEILKYLNADKKAVNKAKNLQEIITCNLPAKKDDIKFLPANYSTEDIISLIYVMKALHIINEGEFVEYTCTLNETISSGCCRISDLAVNGNDLIKIGFCGSEIKRIQNMLLKYVITGRAKNKKDELIKVALESKK